MSRLDAILPSAPAARRPLAQTFLRVVSSLWTSVTLISLIVVYSALGSAIPPFRQYFELSESAYFSHPLFGVLVIALCFSTIVATAWRIKFTLVNLGVILTHTGLLLLAGGAMLYFGRKIEGDVLLAAPQVRVLSQQRLARGEFDSAQIGSLVAAEGKTWQTNMPMAGGSYQAEVVKVVHNGLTTASEVTLNVKAGAEAEPRTVVLSQGDPKSSFVRFDDNVTFGISPATVIDRFYDGQEMSLTVSVKGRSLVFPMPGLPQYNERFLPGGPEIRDTLGRVVRSERYRPIPGIDAWALPIPIVTPDTPRSAESEDWPFFAEVDGFLPYADVHAEPVPGGSTFNPVALVDIRFNGQTAHANLFGTVPARSQDGWSGGASFEFRWLDPPEIPAAWRESLNGLHVLVVEVKDPPVRRTYDVKPGQQIAVEGTDYKLKVNQLLPSWPLMTPGFERASSPVAQVSVETAGKKYQRTVIERYPHLSQDIDEQGTRHREGPYDPNLMLTYKNCAQHSFLLAAGPGLSPVLIHTAPGGKRVVQALAPGDDFAATPEIGLTLRDLIEKPDLAARPVVVPMIHRQRQMGRNASLVRVHIWAKDNSWSQYVWVPFTQYGYVDDRRAVPVSVPEVGRVEFVYGRTGRPLGGTVTLEQMAVQFNPGRSSVRDWRSFLRLRPEGSEQVALGSVYLNHTYRFGDWTLYQSGAAQDHESWTVLGVGNRQGIVTMTVGCLLITLGMLYAFYVKPPLKRRRKQRLARTPGDSTGGNGHDAALTPVHARSAGAGVASLLLAAFVGLSAAAFAHAQASDPAAAAPPAGAMPDDDVHRPFRGDGNAPAAAPAPRDEAERAAARRKAGEDALATLLKMVPQLDLEAFRLLAVQHGARYHTVESWARDVVKTIHGRKPLFDCDPVAAALEIVFNPRPYVDQDLIYIKDIGIRHDITSHPVELDDARMRQIRRTGMVSYRFINDEQVVAIFRELKTRVPLQRAIERAENAIFTFERAGSLLRVVPDPTGGWDARWYTLDDLVGNVGVSGHGAGVPGVSAETADPLVRAYARLGHAWQQRDVKAVNENLAVLATGLPALARPGTYLSQQQRQVDAFYHRANAFTWAWAIYLAGLVAAVGALMTRFRAAYAVAVLIFLAGFVLHGFGLGLRWYILGRIPVANMFEAVVASAFVGAGLALGLEWRMLRALQTVYLVPMCFAVVLHQRYADSPWHSLWMVLAAISAFGLLADMTYLRVTRRRRSEADAAAADRTMPAGVYILAACFLGFLSLILGEKAAGSEITSIAGILDDVLLRIHTVLIIVSYAIVTLAYGVANTYLFVRAIRYGSDPARVTLGCQVGAGIALYAALYGKLGPSAEAGMIVAVISLATLAGGLAAWIVGLLLSGAGRGMVLPGPGAAGIVSVAYAAPPRPIPQSPLLAGLDVSQMTLLNMANIGLFVGTILGAVWADYSWGRPWGWDPKEVFALNTWLIYAILIHARFLARDKALWSAIVAVIGFAMMMFNWWAVNFFIVGLHSYA